MSAEILSAESTRRQAFEQALRKSEERFRRVVEAAPNAMVMVGSGGLIEMVNAQAERMFGYGRAEMLGVPVELLVPHRFRGGHPEKRRSFFQAPVSRPMGAGRDLYGLRKDGSEFPVEIGLNPIETEDGIMTLSAIVDISDRKLKEESIRQALKEKDILLGEIHHRVKNNLQIVHSLLDLQCAQLDDETVLGMLRDSQNRIRSMALIHQTLYQSKDFALVDFRLFLEELVPILVSSYRANTNPLELRVDASEVQLPINAAVPCGLIVNELIANALKHAFPDGRSGIITIDLKKLSAERIILSVSDDGVGMPDGIAPEQSGTLGLQLVNLLADQLGGELTVRRREPTTFTLNFPVKA
ncbi:MAG TPA: histidine kinase dimerization/phosphoacceptor domain -containing protein [Aliidongia sp.]|nr:histidine kinase dimerization/phosphoacceptor domain -containing protein [Aliidongia sp.]